MKRARRQCGAVEQRIRHWIDSFRQTEAIFSNLSTSPDFHRNKLQQEPVVPVFLSQDDVMEVNSQTASFCEAEINLGVSYEVSSLQQCDGLRKILYRR